MEEALFAILFVLAVVGGWVLGIIGFFSARRALGEIAALRHQVEAIQPRADAVSGAPIPDAPPVAAETGPPFAGQPGPIPAPWGRPPPSQAASAVPADAIVSNDASAEDVLSSPAPESPAPEPPPAKPPRAKPPRDFETLLTTRWGIWLGAAALLMAGVFLIRYAVEQEMLGPGVRCVLAVLLGVALIAAAEWLYRRDPIRAFGASGTAPDGAAEGQLLHPTTQAADAADRQAQEPAAGDAPPARPGTAAMADQAPAALAAGGVGALFGAAYGAGVLYELVPPGLGFILLAAASLAGLLLSLRHGQLVAALGIVGAFATPALVQTSDPSMPGLFAYLLAVSAASLAIIRYTAWVWLGWATTIAGAIWVLIALAAGPGTDSWAPALFVPAVAALSLFLLPGAALNQPIGRRLAWIPVAVLGAAGLMLAWDLQTWDARAGVLLLAPLTVWVAAREPRLRLLPFLSALLFLLLLAAWSVDITDWPGFAELPQNWTPAVVRGLLLTAGLVSAFQVASGLWFQQRTPHPLPWASLAASVPVLALVICYWRVALFQARPDWAAAAFALAAGLTGVASWEMRSAFPSARQVAGVDAAGIQVSGVHVSGVHVAGVHAAGAVAALALGCAMLLADQWLTIAVSLFLPALAWIEARTDLRPLRRVALAVAAVVLVRLLLNWHVLDYGFGTTPVLNGLLPAYGIPAVAFAYAAWLFQRRGDDVTVGVLEAGAVAFLTVLVGMEVRQISSDGTITRAELAFAEAALHVSSLGVLAVVMMRIATRLDRPVLGWGWRIQGVVGLIWGVGLLVENPLVSGDHVGHWPLFNWLLPAYLLPAGLALVAARHPATATPLRLRLVLAIYALCAGFTWITLETRHLFHGPRIGLSLPALDPELWALSGAWLVYGAVLLTIGFRRGLKPLRLTALAIIALAAAKVFIIDMSDLTGLWRVLSFLGLGLALIALGSVYRRMAGAAVPTPS